MAKKEDILFDDVMRHYQLAREDLDQRIPQFDTNDELFRSYINDTNWPYRSVVFDPRTFTSIFEKGARLFANKPRGRMVPREGGDALGAKIVNELTSYQWDDVVRTNGVPMIARWAMMDQNARKYGASFALVKWHYKTSYKKDEEIPWFDGPNFQPLVNRDCLPNPSYSTIKNWFQYREYMTLEELEMVNDAARKKAIYKNLDALRDMLKSEKVPGGTVGTLDTRMNNWQSKNKQISKVSDQLGRDQVYKTIEVVTEYRNDRWVTFSPKHGLILRDIENPYDHGQIPVVMLKYYAVDDDLYGLSEIEPIEKLQKATNALVCQYLDAINMSLYTPLKIRSSGVQMNTIEWGPGEKWIMANPADDVVAHTQDISGVTEFTSTYRFMIGAIQEALGETSAGISNIVPGKVERTATEIRSSDVQRNARDNFNLIFLSEALKRQMNLWYMMDRQFYFSSREDQAKVIRIVGKDAMRYFEARGLNGQGFSPEALDMLMSEEGMNMDPRDLAEPLFPVKIGKDTLPKFYLEEGGELGHLYIEPEDLSGVYDYIPDIESMTLPDTDSIVQAKTQLILQLKDPNTQQILANEGFSIKFKEVIEDFFEDLGLKDADKYFTKAQPMGGMNGQAEQTGAGSPQAGPPNLGNGGNQGLQGGIPPIPGI